MVCSHPILYCSQSAFSFLFKERRDITCAAWKSAIGQDVFTYLLIIFLNLFLVLKCLLQGYPEALLLTQHATSCIQPVAFVLH